VEDVEELYKIFPPEYARMDGALLGEHWAGKDVPVPPDWVKERVQLPRGCENACLAKEIDDLFPEASRDLLVDYIKSWRRVKQYGYMLVIAGSGSTYKRREWAACAVINEIVMRFGTTQDISAMWANVSLFKSMVGLQRERYDAYASLRSKLLTTKILLIEDPQQITPRSEERWVLEDVMRGRGDRLLPTIVTVASKPTDEQFDDIRDIVGETVADTMQIYTKWLVPL
jgi:hypothetical protein